MRLAACVLLGLAGCAAPPAVLVTDAPAAEAAPPAAAPGGPPPPAAFQPAVARGLRRMALAPFLVDPWNHTASPGRPGEPAPVPNRGLDPVFSQPAADPSFGPTLIGPRTALDPSAAIGPGHLRTRDDRLFQQPAAGASLRLPLVQ